MSKRISKAVREEAIRICSAKASDWSYAATRFTQPHYDLYAYSHDEDALHLARCAFATAPHLGDTRLFVLEWAEAEAMLRTGFIPEGWGL